LHSPYINNQTFTASGKPCVEGPLVKIIKTNKPLSIQVHPDDKMAKELEGQPNGKSEC
jgi:mannose-6-phosphate isomerase